MKRINRIEVDSRLKFNNVLRRYLDVPRFINFLMSSSLYFCRTDLFPDKFEGSFTPSVRDAICAAYKINKIENTYEKFKKELRESVFISCWSLGVDDNMALWQRFGSTNNCLAITTTVKKLKVALNQFNGIGQLSIRKVDYIRHWKDPAIDVNPYSSVFRYKAVGYEFEKEVRIIIDRFDFKSGEKDNGVLVPTDLSSFIRSIVVSPECSTWFRSVIKDISAKYGISCPVRNSSMAKEPI